MAAWLPQEGEIGGGGGGLNVAILQKKNQAHTATTTLYVTFRAKSTEITIKNLFMNVKSSAFHFQSVSETNGNWKMLRNGGGFGG